MESKLKEYDSMKDADLIRAYLQDMFWDATKGIFPRKDDVPYDMLEKLIESKDDKIRKWAYYVACFFSNGKILDTLKKNIRDEKNKLIQSWMLAAACCAKVNLYEELKKKDLGLPQNTICLIENLFRDGCNDAAINKRFIDDVLWGESEIDKCWLTFNYKYKPYICGAGSNEVISMEHISFLTNISQNSHDDPALLHVEEYALSALCHYDPYGCFSFSKSVEFDIRDIHKRHPGPRKWAYNLFWKDADYVNAHLGDAKEYIKGNPLGDKDREGFAQGLSAHYGFNKELETLIVRWFMHEDHALCRKHLLNYMARHQHQSDMFRKQVEEEQSHVEQPQSVTILQLGFGLNAQVGNGNIKT